MTMATRWHRACEKIGPLITPKMKGMLLMHEGHETFQHAYGWVYGDEEKNVRVSITLSNHEWEMAGEHIETLMKAKCSQALMSAKIFVKDRDKVIV
jgi:hypothetical protein